MNVSVMRDFKNEQLPLKPEFDFFSQFLITKKDYLLI
jgi:hypothetical protein